MSSLLIQISVICFSFSIAVIGLLFVGKTFAHLTGLQDDRDGFI